VEVNGRTCLMSWLLKRALLYFTACLLLVLTGKYFHIYSDLTDRSLTKKIEQELEARGETYVSTGAKSSRFCVLGPYGSPSEIQAELSQVQYQKLSLRINNFIGRADNVVWFVELIDSEELILYRTSARIRPEFKKGKCVGSGSVRLRFLNYSRPNKQGYIYFDLERIE
jgi:hypothetical protein